MGAELPRHASVACMFRALRRGQGAPALLAVSLHTSFLLAQEAPPAEAPPTAEAPPSDAPPPPPPAEAPAPPAAPTPEAPPPEAPLPAPPVTAPPPPANAAFPAPAEPPAPVPAKPPPRAARPPAAEASAPPAPPPAEPARQASPPAPFRDQAKSEPDDDEEPDTFRIGLLLGGGLPSLLSLGGMLKLTRFLGAGVNVGLIPKVQLSYYGDATLSYQHYDIYGRLFPFGGGFFLGAGAGYATVEGTLSKTIDTSMFAGAAPASGLPRSLAYESRASVRTLVLTTLIGYLYTFNSGFTLGVDAGAQIPIAPSQIDFESGVSGGFPPAFVEQYLAPTDASVQSSLEKLGRTTLPTVNLRLGWLL